MLACSSSPPCPLDATRQLCSRTVDGLWRRREARLEVDAELTQLDDRRHTPADRVGREREHERHPVRLAKRLAITQDAEVAWCCPRTMITLPASEAGTSQGLLVAKSRAFCVG
jgi:hypothetical protein